jgi:hypothetical protein
MTRLLLPLVAWMFTGALAQDGASGCGPIDEAPVADEPSTTNTIDAGRLQDDDVTLAWRLYDPWDQGACLELTFTNIGEQIEDWRFDVTLDRQVSETQYGGPTPEKVSVVLDELSLLPIGSPSISPLGVVSYALCLEPEVRPIALDAVVVREADTDAGLGESDEPEVRPAFGWLYDDQQAIQLTWLEEVDREDAFCLELRLGNLTEDRLQDWSVRVRFDEDVVFTEYDTSFFWFYVDLNEIEISPTEGTRRFDPAMIHSGIACFEARAEPVSFVSSFVPVVPTTTSVVAAWPPPPVGLGFPEVAASLRSVCELP